jgi:hypothetical protein
LDGKVVGVVKWKRQGGENLSFAVGADALERLFASAVAEPQSLRAFTSQQAPPPTAAVTSQQAPPSNAGVFLVAYRTSKHQTYSTPDVFQEIVDDLLQFLKSQRVVLYNDAIGQTVQTN